MLLKKGITGFYSAGSFPPEMNNYEAFRKNIYLLANTNGLKINDIKNSDDTNYFYVEFDSIYFLANKYYAVAGFTENISHGDKIFKDSYINRIYLPEYEIIPAMILNSFFDKTENNLSKCELEQVRYYSPVSVGNIIFNEWD